MTTHIRFDHSGESQVFTLARDIRNSDHALGTLEKGARVFFRRGEGIIVLVSEPSGKPTNGSEYALFSSRASAERFVERSGLVEIL